MTAKPSPSDEKVILLAPSGRDALLAQQALAGAGIQSQICACVSDVVGELRRGAGAAVIAVEAIAENDLAKLSSVLDDQPEWSDVGLILLAHPSASEVSRERLVRSLRALPNANLLERPLRARTLVTTVETALRSRRRQYELRSHLIERERLKLELENEYDRQHRIAETLQLSLLSPPKGRLHPLLDTATIYRAASEEADVGGDFYDQFLLDDRRIALIVGDVSGKGLRAAASTMEVKYPLRAFLRETGSPGSSLARLSNFLVRSHQLDDIENAGFICLVACVVDTVAQTLVYANAGLEPPLLQRAGGSVVELSGTTTPLGVDFGADSPEVELEFNFGDTVLIATDGIIEARRGDAFFGHEGMRAAMQTVAGSRVDVIVGHVVNSALNFAGGKLTDDACVLGVRFVSGQVDLD